MAPKSLADQIEEAGGDVANMLRAQGGAYENNFPVVPNEQTHWLDEQRAAYTSVALADLSHHMTSVRATGPDAVRLFSDLCINDLSDFEVGKAKQAVLCTPAGKVLGDGPILRLDDEEVWGVPVYCGDWIEYQVETGDYDVDVEIEFPTSYLDGDPELYIFQVQGPDAFDVLEQLTDADLEDIGFYRFETIEMAGLEVRALGHGMNTESGFEFHGPFEESEALRTAILEAGEEYGIRQLGSKAYLSQSIRVGWIPPGPPPMYTGDELAEYREWLPADSRTGNYSIGGSYDPDDFSDYYMSPVEIGYENLVDLEHDFVGREAIAEELEDPQRTKVSLQWDREDALDIFGSLFRPGVLDGENYKTMDLPRVGWAWLMADEVRRDGEPVGVSYSRAYQSDVQAMVSLAVLDRDVAEPGTEVEIRWGELDGHSPNPWVEEHSLTEIAATVQPVPYTEDRRKLAAD